MTTTTTTSVHPAPPQYMQSQPLDSTAMDITHKIADLVVEKLRPELNQLILQQCENIKQTIVQNLLESKKTYKNNGTLTTQQRNKMRDLARGKLDIQKRLMNQDMHMVQDLICEMQGIWNDLEGYIIEKALKDFLENTVEYQKQKENKPEMLKRKAENQKARRQSKKHNSNGSGSPTPSSPAATTLTSQTQNTPTHSIPLSSLNSPVVLGARMAYLGVFAFVSCHGRYLRGNNYGQMQIIQEVRNLGDEECWHVYKVDKKLALQNYKSNKWLCGEPSGKAICDRTKLEDWENWDAFICKNKVSFRSAHNMWLCEQSGGEVVANRKVKGPWEDFDMIPVPYHPFPGEPWWKIVLNFASSDTPVLISAL